MGRAARQGSWGADPHGEASQTITSAITIVISAVAARNKDGVNTRTTHKNFAAAVPHAPHTGINGNLT